MEKVKQLALDLTSEAIERVAAHAHQEWRSEARHVVERLASTKSLFTADEVWAELDKASFTTHEPTALGAVMRDAVRTGTIMATGSYWPTKRSAAHRRPVAVYRSGLPL